MFCRYGFRRPPIWNLEIRPYYGGKELREAARSNEVPPIVINLVQKAVQTIRDRAQTELNKRLVFPNLGNLLLPAFPTPDWYR